MASPSQPRQPTNSDSKQGNQQPAPQSPRMDAPPPYDQTASRRADDSTTTPHDPATTPRASSCAAKTQKPRHEHSRACCSIHSEAGCCNIHSDGKFSPSKRILSVPPWRQFLSDLVEVTKHFLAPQKRSLEHNNRMGHVTHFL
jgi:hypothetical protein